MQELLRRVRRAPKEPEVEICASKTLAEELSRGEGASIIRLVETLLEHAHTLGVSDIHIDPTATCLRVRVRVDGVLKEVECFGTGYKGRISLNEVLVATDAIRHAILTQASTRDITALGEADDMKTMKEDGFEKLREGMTSVEEILKQ